MSSEIPNLPPRRRESTSKHSYTAISSHNFNFYSPLALLVHLENQHSDHRHVFKNFVTEPPAATTAENQSPSVSETGEALKDNADLQENIIVTTETASVSEFCCQVCHSWLNVTHTTIPLKEENGTPQNTCRGNDYICHHYHAQGIDTFQCCGCEYTLTTELQDPLLPLTLFRRLEATRNKARSYAETMQNSNAVIKPTLVSTLTTVLIYIRDLLSGSKRNINVNNPHFLARIGLSDGSQALLEEIGFIMEDNYFIVPDIEIGSLSYKRLKRIQRELILTLDQLRKELGLASVAHSVGEVNTKVNDADMYALFGHNPKLEDRCTSKNDYADKAYASFGLTPGASDTLVAWTYNRIINDSDYRMDPYDALDSLIAIATQTNSEELMTLVACERSKGNIARTDIGDAYAYFGVSEDAADDKLLIGLYQVKLSDEPAKKNTLQDKLKTIAIARNSTDLIDFLKEEKEDLTGVPSHMINNIQQTPVGLNNIGNTCYFNSLLQYYFTLVPFRQTMIFNELYVEDANSQPKKIGGIKVDQQEIRRAKKFVELLKTLFINLQETSQKAISPEYELAYMALLNEKDEEDTTDTPQETKSIQEDTTVKVDKDLLNIDATIVPANADTVDNEAEDSEMTEADSSFALEDKTDTDEKTSFESNRSDSPPPPYDNTESKPHFEADVRKTVVQAPKLKQRPSADTMMFGKQQDVTECMGNVMYLVEAALKPLKKTEDGEQVEDMIRQVFYGKARQILTYRDNTTSQTVKKEMEEDFSHVIVDASEGKNLYDGLDEYFFANQVENYQGGHEATREVTVKSFPPILQILVQRVQFDRATANVYKSNAYVQFDRTIFLDRYAVANFESLRERRAEVAQWRMELEETEQYLAKYKQSNSLKIPIPDLLQITSNLLNDSSISVVDMGQAELDSTIESLLKEATKAQSIIEVSTERIRDLRARIKNQYTDLTSLTYKLHAVFIHQGQANYGHYWIYILDHDEDQWWKYNDSTVTKVDEAEIYHNTTGSTANPYFLVYVDASKVNEFVETIVQNALTDNGV